MKKSLLALCAALVLTPVAFAETNFGSNNPSNASAASVMSVASVVTGSVFLVIAAPVLSVISVSDNASRLDQVHLRVVDDKGQVVTLPVNKNAATRAGLKAGDTLTSVPRKSGVLLSKEGTPISFVVPPENAKLTKNVELAR